MTQNSDGDEPYQVGKGKPPKHTQFQPGNKAASKRKPKAPMFTPEDDPTGMMNAIADLLDTKVKLTKGGKSTHVPFPTAFIASLAQDSLSAPPKVKMMILREAAKIGLFDFLVMKQKLENFECPVCADDVWTEENEAAYLLIESEFMDKDQSSNWTTGSTYPSP